MKTCVFTGFLLVLLGGCGASPKGNSPLDAKTELAQDADAIDSQPVDPPWDPWTYVPYPSDWSEWEKCYETPWAPCKPCKTNRDCPPEFSCYCCIEGPYACSCWPAGTFDNYYYQCLDH